MSDNVHESRPATNFTDALVFVCALALAVMEFGDAQDPQRRLRFVGLTVLLLVIVLRWIRGMAFWRTRRNR
jgi:hypothetical protein